MFCTKCGARIDDESVFCTNCGAPVEDTTATSQSEPQLESVQGTPTQMSPVVVVTQPQQRSKMRLLVWLILVLVVVVGILVAFILFDNSNSKQSADKTTTTSVTGTQNGSTSSSSSGTSTTTSVTGTNATSTGSPSAAGSSTGTGTSDNAGGTTYYVHAYEYITLRTGPATTYDAITRIPTGSSLTYLGDAGNGFAKVSFEGTEGYVMSSYIASTPGAPTYYVHASDYVTLRTSPTTSASAITTIPAGAAVAYYGDEANGFSEVSYDGSVGYVLKSYISATP